MRAGATSPDLGTAGSFGVLAGSAVTNTGPTTVDGDVGVSPATSVTGFPPGFLNGTIHAGDAVAAQAQSDASTAYNDAAGQPCDSNLTGQNLGGLTLSPGVYCFDSSAQLTGQLTLDGSSSGVFVFKIGSTLTTASNADVSLIDGAQPCNVFWQVGSSATLGTNTAFAGNILALTSITLNTGASTEGGLYARNGAVTLDTNDIQACDFAQPAPTDTPTATSTAAATNTATNTATATGTSTAIAPTAANTSTPTVRATSTASATSTVTPSNTATAQPPTRAPADTPEPTETVDTPDDTAVPGTATSESTPTSATSTVTLPTSTPPDSATATNTATNTITLSTPDATLTGTPVSTQTPGAPSATSTATLLTPTESPAAPAQTFTETPVAPESTTLATQVAVPGPPLLLPPTGGGPPTVDGLPWYGPLVLLLNAMLLMAALGLRSLLRARRER
ncbi:MAG: ice-binding family protein [Chloroflexota bacterium]|nr:ice-binding family protein [Chloroflexota bacterium]